MRLALTFLPALLSAQAVQVAPSAPRQGDVVRIAAPPEAAAARMGGRTVRLFPQASGGAFGLMPVPANEVPGQYKVEVLGRDKAPVGTVTVTVRDAHFPAQNVIIGQAEIELKPLPGEMETLTRFRQTVSEIRYWTEPFQLPVPGCMTSPFGVRRLYNGKPGGNYHGGVDQRGAAGHPVRAIADGVVGLVRELTLNGKTVGIDHGQGLASVYQHLSGFAVAEGAHVRKGDVVGYVGSTGRSNAPHLHWSVFASAVPVNPAQWVKLQSCYAQKKAR